MIAAALLAAVTIGPLSVQLTVTPAKVMLGAPVWIQERVQNMSTNRIVTDLGNVCNTGYAVNVRVPAAKQIKDPNVPCGAGNSLVKPGTTSCIVGFTDFGPGEIKYRRFVFKGAFKIIRPGTYRVQMAQTIAYTNDPNRGFSNTQSFAATTDLVVIKPNAATILSQERALAEHAERIRPFIQLPATAEATRETQATAYNLQFAIFEGIATYPVAGMETVFGRWADRSNSSFSALGIEALKNVNTRRSHEILASIAREQPPSADPNLQILRMEATRALGETDDAAYLSLLEELTRDPNREVARAAVLGLGGLGAPSVAFLSKFARTATNEADRNDAVTALGTTGSIDAVQPLIEQLTLPGGLEANYALWVLTHHQIPEADQLSGAKSQADWQAWWQQNRTTARAFGPNDCPKPS